MKFKVGDRVRVIAWAVPGTNTLFVVCGRHGLVVKERVNDPDAGSDGVYKVTIDGMGGSNPTGYWFRACDLVAEDSECTCDNTARKAVIGECLIHDRPDPDPTAEAAARLQVMANDMENHLRCVHCDGAGIVMDRNHDDVACSMCNGTGRKS